MKFAIGLLAYVLTLFSSVALPHSDASQPFSLTLHEPKAPARVGSEIHLTVTVANTSNHDVSFGVAPGIAPDQTMSYNIEIRDAQGREAPPTPFLRDLREHPKPTSGSIFGYTLAPGESYEEELVITRLYDLTQPGKYTIKVARSQQPWPNAAAIVKSNTIAIAVSK